jgi:hypothetical protein
MGTRTAAGTQSGSSRALLRSRRQPPARRVPGTSGGAMVLRVEVCQLARDAGSATVLAGEEPGFMLVVR